MNDITKVSQIQQALATAKTPQETKQIEAAAKAAQAWAKEQHDYELLVASMHVWIMARRKTTELIKPNILHGSKDGYGNRDVTLADYGFTKQQWYRRVKELEISEEDINAYFDDCISNGWEPTSFGLKLWKSGPHISYNSGENEWYTPPEYITAARLVLGEIDLDPASSDKANEIVQAKKYYTKHNSGLIDSNEWSGKVWMNPPYASELIVPFVERYVLEVRTLSVTAGIVLVNNATETGWFEKLVNTSKAVVFTNERVKFLDPQGNPGAPLQGQAILYYGEHVKKFRKEFEKFGWSATL